jgi:predicted CXXCH cytochrome family protein
MPFSDRRRKEAMSKRTVVAITLLLFAGSAQALTIVGSKHDLSSLNTTAWGGTAGPTSTNQTCVFCHTPHGGQAGNYLWNHSTSNPSYTVYTSTTIGNIPSSPAGSTSGACLSCHDGTIAVTAVTKNPFNTTTGLRTPITVVGSPTFLTATGLLAPASNAFIGTNLTTHHPIHMTYNTALDTSLKTAAGPGRVDSAGNIRLFGSGATAATNFVECGSCHRVHDNAIKPFLALTMDQSALCTTCHNK